MADISRIAIEGAGEYNIKDNTARDTDSRQDDNLRQLWNKLAELQTIVDTASAEITAIKQELQIDSEAIGTNAENITALKSGKVNKSGDTMTGDLNVSNERPIVRLMAGNQYTALYHQGDGTNLAMFENDVKQNRLVLRADSSILERPLIVSSGGTGGTSKTSATNNIGAYSLIGGTQIPANADLNSYKTVGNYYCPANVTVATLSNRAPSPDAFRMTVSIGVGASGDTTTHGSYIRQDLFDFSGRTFTRVFISPNWGPWLRHFDSAQTIPVANGGTGATTLAAVKTGFGITDVANVSKSFSIESGRLMGSVDYLMKSGVVFVKLFVNRIAGGSVSNGLRSTGVVLPSNMCPIAPQRSGQMAATNNYPDPMPSVYLQVDTNGTVQFLYTAGIAPSSGIWTYTTTLAFAPGM